MTTPHSLSPPFDSAIPVAKSPTQVPSAQKHEPRTVLDLHAFEECDLELIACGAYAPLRGFIGADDFASVLERSRLATGALWPIPMVLSRDASRLRKIGAGSVIALRGAAGQIRAQLRVSEVYPHERTQHAARVFGTADPAHPGVARIWKLMGDHCLAGEIELVGDWRPKDALAALRFTPAETRELFRVRGWKRIVAFQTRNAPHRGHEYLTKAALEFADGLFFHPLVGDTHADDTTATVRMRCYEELLRNYYPAERVLLAAFPAAMRYAGPREALLHALARKNYGATHFIVGRDHAGVARADGSAWYEGRAAQQYLEQFTADELGIEILAAGNAFYDRRSAGVVSDKTAPPGAQPVSLSGTALRALIAAGELPPVEIIRPEVARVLIDSERTNARSGADGAPSAAASGAKAPVRGFCLWLTGLPSAGKSTIALGVAERLRARGLPVEILDGDEVRLALSPELGYSKTERDTHVQRLGYLCQLLVRNGVITICAAISPYRAARDANRARIARFIEVFVNCSLENLIARDVKGLYRRALAGEIQNFTGVSDPYEEPLHAELELHTDRETVAESIARVMAHLDAEFK